MAYVKYFWGFDSSTEGWNGGGTQWEGGGVGGLPTGHLFQGYSRYVGAGYHPGLDNTYVFSSPRNLDIRSGDILCFIVSTYHTPGGGFSITVEIVDASETVVWSKTLNADTYLNNTPYAAILVLGSDGSGINIKVRVWTGGCDYCTQEADARIDSVTIYSNPDQIIYTTLPSTLQLTLTHEIPINKSGSYILGAIRFDNVQNLSTYSESVIYDGSGSKSYSNNLNDTVSTTTSVDKITITHNADSTLQVYYTVKHAVWLLDPSTYEPRWLALIVIYHNQNVTNPDTLSFSTVLDGSAPYSETQTMALKFTADGLFNLNLTPSADVTGDTSQITQLQAVITVKDSGGTPIATSTLDILTGTYDQIIQIPKTYDNQDLTIEVTINADGLATETVTVKLKLNFEFAY